MGDYAKVSSVSSMDLSTSKALYGSGDLGELHLPQRYLIVVTAGGETNAGM